jgi:hypothetical protein
MVDGFWGKKQEARGKRREARGEKTRSEKNNLLASCFLLLSFTVEAQGIEPWSESASGTASTCVGSASSLASGRHGTSLPDVDLRQCSFPVVEGHRSLVRIFDPMEAPRTGSCHRRCYKRARSSAYAAIARSELAGKSVPKGLSRISDLGTRRSLHPTRRSQSPPS